MGVIGSLPKLQMVDELRRMRVIVWSAAFMGGHERFVFALELLAASIKSTFFQSLFMMLDILAQ